MEPDDPAQTLALAHDAGRNRYRDRQALKAAPTAPDAEIAQGVDEAVGRLFALRLQFQTKEAARAAQLAAGQFRLRVGGQAGIVDGGDLWMTEQGVRQASRVLLMPLHADRQRAQAAQH